MADPRRSDRINTTRVTAADLLPLLFPPRSAENQEGSNPTEVPPYTLLPTVGEATIGFNHDTMEDPPSYPLSTLSDPTQVYEESRSEEAAVEPRATFGAPPVPAIHLLPLIYLFPIVLPV